MTTISQINTRNDDTLTTHDRPATPRQLKFIWAIARQTGLTEEELSDDVFLAYGVAIGEMTRRQASDYIERLQGRRGAIDLAS